MTDRRIVRDKFVNVTSPFYAGGINREREREREREKEREIGRSNTHY